MNKLFTVLATIVVFLMAALASGLAWTASNDAASLTLALLSVVLLVCGMTVAENIGFTPNKKESTMSYCERNCPLPFHTCGLEEEVFEDYAEEALEIMIEEAEAAQELHDEHYVGAHNGGLQPGCPDCDAIKGEFKELNIPPFEDLPY